MRLRCWWRLFFGVVGFAALLMASSCTQVVMRPATNCGPSAVMSEGICRVPSQVHLYRLPFPDNVVTVVGQGYYGSETHAKSQHFAIDFSCNDGDPIVAARSGVVLDKHDEGERGCFDSRCANDANYIVIDHGDGTFATYSHLQKSSIPLKRGERVCKGELVGRCGATGYVTGPHLHFSVADAARRTIPVTFDFGSQSPRTTLVKGEELQVPHDQDVGRCEEVSYSLLGPYAFAHLGILLDAPVSVNLRPEGALQIRGRLLDSSLKRRRQAQTNHRNWIPSPNDAASAQLREPPYDMVALHVAAAGKELRWRTFCIPTDGDEKFSISLAPQEFPPTPTPTDTPDPKVPHSPTKGYWFVVTTAQKTPQGCLSRGWPWAYQVFVDGD